MSIVCLAPHMYAIMKIRVYKAVIQWEQGLIVKNFSWLQYDTDTFMMYMICEDHFNFLSIMTPRNFVSFTSCTLIRFITISSVQREKFFGVNNIKLVLSMFKDSLLALTQA